MLRLLEPIAAWLFFDTRVSNSGMIAAKSHPQFYASCSSAYMLSKTELIITSSKA